MVRALAYQAPLENKLERLAALVQTLDAWKGPVDALQLAHAELQADASDAAARSAVRSARGDLRCAPEPHAVWLARSEVYAFNDATFAQDEVTRGLDRVLSAAVSAGVKTWGRSSTRRCALIEAEAVPACRDLAPRHLALALLFRNGDRAFAHAPTYVTALQEVVAEAERTKTPRAAWLPPYNWEVAPGAFVTLRDKAIRDPYDGATRVVTVRVSP